MTRFSDALSDFVEMTSLRYQSDHHFRKRLLAETDETPRETAQRIGRENFAVALRRTAS